MHSLFFLAVASFLLSLILTPLCRNLFRNLGIVDQPDKHRKLHVQPVPAIGGVPILLAYLLSCSVLLLAPPAQGLAHGGKLYIVWKLIPALLVVFLTGLMDDLLHLKPWQKLVGQVAGSCIAYWAGVRIVGIAGHSIESWWNLPLTVLWLIACTNSFNLIDGLDGLASGVGLFATATTLIAAMLQQNIPLAAATVPLAGALLGFLRYNFNPASIFLGDSGSLIIGFLLGSFGVIWSQKSATLLGMTAPLMALSIPLLDTSLSVIRRFLRGQPIFSGDRGHIHHRLLDRGLAPRRVALLLYGVCSLGAVFSLLQSVVSNHIAGAVIILFCMVTWIGIQHLGYAEFNVAGHLFLRGEFRHALDAHLCLRSFEQQLAATSTLDNCWTAILDGCRTFDFIEVRMRIAGRLYEERLRETNGSLCWNLRVPLLASDYINFTRPHESAVMPMGIGPFADVIRRTIEAKYPSLKTIAEAAIGAAR